MVFRRSRCEVGAQHRNLLALARRDLIVDKEAEVAVHIVLPLEEGTPGDDAEDTRGKRQAEK